MSKGRIGLKTARDSQLSQLRFVSGRVECVATYDMNGWPAQAGSVVVLVLNGTTALEIRLEQGFEGSRQEQAVLNLQPGTNTLQLVARLYDGNNRSTRAGLTVLDNAQAIIQVGYETDQLIENIDQAWKLVFRHSAP